MGSGLERCVPFHYAFAQQVQIKPHSLCAKNNDLTLLHPLDAATNAARGVRIDWLVGQHSVDGILQITVLHLIGILAIVVDGSAVG